MNGFLSIQSRRTNVTKLSCTRYRLSLPNLIEYFVQKLKMEDEFVETLSRRKNAPITQHFPHAHGS